VGGIGAFFSGNPADAGGRPLVTCVVPSLLFDDVTLVASQGPFPNRS
jgi:hypothetical protein